jgi:hypothetical protein
MYGACPIFIITIPLGNKRNGVWKILLSLARQEAFRGVMTGLHTLNYTFLLLFGAGAATIGHVIDRPKCECGRKF